jgi:hypothetical protein
MQQKHQFPMVLTHRGNPHAQIVVANAEQLAEVPEEFLPVDVMTAIVTAGAAIPGVNLETASNAGTVDSAEEAERRKSLDEAVDEFTAHVQAETSKLDAARAELERDRAALQQGVAALEEQQEALARERAEFEAQRATTTTAAGTGDIGGETGAASASTEGAATGETAAAAAAPAKRTRAAKEGA